MGEKEALTKKIFGKGNERGVRITPQIIWAIGTCQMAFLLKGGGIKGRIKDNSLNPFLGLNGEWN